jgi:hypothetical protein
MERYLEAKGTPDERKAVLLRHAEKLMEGQD